MKRSSIWIALTAMAAVQLMAQTTEIVRVHNQPADVINKLIGPMVPNSTRVAYDEQLKVITISGPADVVEMLSKNIARLDVAPTPKSIELTVYLILGSNESDGKLPDDLSGVSKQLHSVFPFKGYQLLDTTVQRSLDGRRVSMTGVFPGAKDRPATYSIQYAGATVMGEGTAKQISIPQFDFQTRSPYYAPSPNGQPTLQFDAAQIRTDVMMREGQKVVIGKSSLGPGKESLFVVLSAKVIE